MTTPLDTQGMSCRGSQAPPQRCWSGRVSRTFVEYGGDCAWARVWFEDLPLSLRGFKCGYPRVGGGCVYPRITIFALRVYASLRRRTMWITTPEVMRTTPPMMRMSWDR